MALISSGRASVHYPWWIHCLAFAVFLANLAKIPRTLHDVRAHLSWMISIRDEIAASDLQAARVGAVLVCVLSGCVGALIIYLMHRRKMRTAHQRIGHSEHHLQAISMWQAVIAVTLIVPDLWYAIFGLPPYMSWQFFPLFFVLVGIVTIWRGRGKDLLATVPASFILGAVL